MATLKDVVTLFQKYIAAKKNKTTQLPDEWDEKILEQIEDFYSTHLESEKKDAKTVEILRINHFLQMLEREIDKGDFHEGLVSTFKMFAEDVRKNYKKYKIDHKSIILLNFTLAHLPSNLPEKFVVENDKYATAMRHIEKCEEIISSTKSSSLEEKQKAVKSCEKYLLAAEYKLRENRCSEQEINNRMAGTRQRLGEFSFEMQLTKNKLALKEVENEAGNAMRMRKAEPIKKAIQEYINIFVDLEHILEKHPSDKNQASINNVQFDILTKIIPSIVNEIKYQEIKNEDELKSLEEALNLQKGLLTDRYGMIKPNFEEEIKKNNEATNEIEAIIKIISNEQKRIHAERGKEQEKEKMEGQRMKSALQHDAFDFKIEFSRNQWALMRSSIDDTSGITSENILNKGNIVKKLEEKRKSLLEEGSRLRTEKENLTERYQSALIQAQQGLAMINEAHLKISRLTLKAGVGAGVGAGVEAEDTARRHSKNICRNRPRSRPRRQ